MGSALSDRAIPLQGGYCAAKHALKAFTDALRMELEEQGIPIAVTLVKPASIDTPFFEKARTYLGVEPQPVPPVYAPEVVADVILHAAATPASRTHRRRVWRQVECRAIRTASRRPVHGAVDIRLAASRTSRSTAALTTCTNRCRLTEASGDETGKVIRARAACIHVRPYIHVRRLPSSPRWRSASELPP